MLILVGPSGSDPSSFVAGVGSATWAASGSSCLAARMEGAPQQDLFRRQRRRTLARAERGQALQLWLWGRPPSPGPPYRLVRPGHQGRAALPGRRAPGGEPRPRRRPHLRGPGCRSAPRPAYDLVYRHALDPSAAGQRLAFGSTTGSLWMSEDQGDTWQTLSNHLPPNACMRFEA